MVMQFERRYSRSDYDKYHRCPGWSGGGWTLAKEGKCPGGIHELCELVLALDSWIVGGGFLPRAWAPGGSA